MLEILIVLHLFLKRLFSYFCLLLATACSTEEGISPFSSDGCSLFPNSSLISEDDWCECCFQHDLSYWRGGSEQERLVADQRLKQCVFEATHDHVLADIMFQGVRFGGSPYFYNWYRWGYGWRYERKYSPLSQEENKQADLQLAKYYSSVLDPTCK